MKQNFQTIDQYIDTFPDDMQERLREIRSLIAEIVPQATETISYNIPTFRLQRNLVHFAGYNKHLGFYPGPPAVEKFSDRLGDYHTSRGTIRFPLDQPLPHDLIAEIVRYRVRMDEENK